MSPRKLSMLAMKYNTNRMKVSQMKCDLKSKITGSGHAHKNFKLPASVIPDVRACFPVASSIIWKFSFMIKVSRNVLFVLKKASTDSEGCTGCNFQMGSSWSAVLGLSLRRAYFLPGLPERLQRQLQLYVARLILHQQLWRDRVGTTKKTLEAWRSHMHPQATPAPLIGLSLWPAGVEYFPR